jgi:hypothetical protein
MGREELKEEEIRQIIKTSKEPVLVAFKPVLAASEEPIGNLLFDNQEVIDTVAAVFAKKNKLHNGATIHYLNDDYRNNNLLFWDAQNEKIVYPFTEYDDYGSVPPIFVVGDGYFNPTDWLDEVEHNATVFPSMTLIREMKEFAATHPKENKMTVEINGKTYLVRYENNFKPKDWDSCILDVDSAFSPFTGRRERKGLDELHVSRGLPIWREDIVEETNANIAAKNAALLTLIAKHTNTNNAKAVLQAEVNRVTTKGGRKRSKKTRKNRK